MAKQDLDGMGKVDIETSDIHKRLSEFNKKEQIVINVRWNDGYLEVFTGSAVRFGSDLLWIRLSNGSNRHIPLRQVRWFSTSPESHENINVGKGIL